MPRTSLVTLGLAGYAAIFIIWPRTAWLMTAFVAFLIALRIAVTYREQSVEMDFYKTVGFSFVSAFSVRNAVVMFTN